MTPMAGTLYLVPNLLGLVPPEDVLPAGTIAIARRLDHFIVENAKPARAFLKILAPERPLRALAISEIGPAPSPAHIADLLAPASSLPRTAKGWSSCRWWGRRRCRSR